MTIGFKQSAGLHATQCKTVSIVAAKKGLLRNTGHSKRRIVHFTTGKLNAAKITPNLFLPSARNQALTKITTAGYA